MVVAFTYSVQRHAAGPSRLTLGNTWKASLLNKRVGLGVFWNGWVRQMRSILDVAVTSVTEEEKDSTSNVGEKCCRWIMKQLGSL
jgi:hypothetical protein